VVWSNLRDSALEEEVGIKGLLFCHNSGYLAGTKTKLSALRLAKIALKYSGKMQNKPNKQTFSHILFSQIGPHRSGDTVLLG